MGLLIQIIRCPFHDDTRRSLAIYQDETGDELMTYFCFGCKATGVVTEDLKEFFDENNAKNIVASGRRRRPIMVDLDEYSYVYDKRAMRFLEEHGIPVEIAKAYGIQQSIYTNDGRSLWLPIYDIEGIEHSGQIRDIHHDPERKYILVPEDDVYPDYSAIPRLLWDMEPPCIFLVESILDGLCLLNKTHIPSLAMLGTKLSESLLTALSTLGVPVIINLDPDAWIAASYIRDRLSVGYGLSVYVFYSQVIVYQQPTEALQLMIKKIKEDMHELEGTETNIL